MHFSEVVYNLKNNILPEKIILLASAEDIRKIEDTIEGM